MATRSRLGRDPLQGAAKPAAKQPAKAQRKSPARAKAAPQPDAVEQNAPPTALANDLIRQPEPAAPDNVQRVGATAPAKTDAPSPTGQAAATPPALGPSPAAPGLPGADDAPDQTTLPDPAVTPTAAASETAQADAPSGAAAGLVDAPGSVDTGLSAATAQAASDHARTQTNEAVLGEAALVQNPSALIAPKTVEVEPAMARCGCTNAPSDMPANLPDVGIIQTAVSAPTVPCPPHPAPAALEQGAHPVEVFLRGVLEGLLPEGEAVLRVEVDPETFALPVEKLFYFSHALQRIVTPMELAQGLDWRPGETAGQLPMLTVRLRAHRGGRHMLTLTDNGEFFRSRLPELRLHMEALKPLVAFIVKRQGSVRLAQGRSITFEIIG